MSRNYDDFTRLECVTTITDFKDGYYAFADTVFYGEKGGMPSDKGTINSLEVTDLKWEGDTLYHKVEGELHDPIHMKVDLIERYINTTVQSAYHLLDGYYERMGYYITTIGVDNHSQWYEVNMKQLPEGHLQDVEDYVNEAIRRRINTEISYIKGSEYPDEKYHKYDEVRIVTFDQLNSQPCGTLHVNNTSDIGNFIVLDAEKSSKGYRIHTTCSYLTNEVMKEYYQLVKESSHLMSGNKDQLLANIHEMVESNREYKKEIAQLKEQLIEYKVRDLALTDDKVIEVSLDELKTFTQKLAAVLKGNKAVIAQNGEQLNYTIVSADGSARAIFDRVRERTGINGGGNPAFVSGRCNLPKEEFIKVINEVL